MAPTAAASAGSAPHPGLTRCARSSSSRAAGEGVPSGWSSTSSGSTAYSVSPRTRSGARLVARTDRSGTASTIAATSGAASSRCSTLSSTRSRCWPRSRSTMSSVTDRAGSRVASTASATAGSSWPGSRSGASSTSAYAVGVAVADRRRRGQGQAGLAHAAGAAEGDQAARAQEVGDAADVVVATDERRGRDRQLAPAGGGVRRRGRRRGARRPRRDRGQQRGALVLAQVQRRRQRAQRVRVGAGPRAALQRADRVRAQPRALRELLLRESGVLPQRAQHRAEGAVPTCPHVTSVAASSHPPSARECSERGCRMKHLKVVG